jgi:hypothetical protein
VTGVLAAFIYRRYRNLLFLAVAHALIGTTLWLVVPDSVSHHLRVGPGMSRHRHRGVPPTDVRYRPDVRGGHLVSDRRAAAREPVGADGVEDLDPPSSE